MTALHELGYIEITDQAGRRIFAKVQAEGQALIQQLKADQAREQEAV